MKKITSVCLAIVMLATSFLFSCNNKKDGEPAVNDNEKLVIWTAHGFDKLRTEKNAPEESSKQYTVTLAKNEYEGVHIGLNANYDTKALSFKQLSGENEHISVSIYHIMEILQLGRKRWTDPAAPLGPGKRFVLKKDETMAIFVDFKTTADTPAGDYTYEFGVLDSKGKVIDKVTITVHVWNFAMPEEHKFQTAVGNHYIVEQYELLRDHNLSGYHLPHGILDERSDKYMSDPRITSFKIPIPKHPDGSYDIEELTKIYNKLKTNDDWLRKAYFYPIDEPSTPDDIDKFEVYCKQLRDLFPDIRITVPYYKDLQITPELDQIDFMDQYVDLHCPKLALWNDDYVYSPEQKEKYPSFAERMKAIQEKGETVWAYVCNYPIAPYLNVKVDDEGIETRALFWQFYQRNIDGFLYWHTADYSHLGNGGNPWDSIDTFQNGIYGDGILIYTGTGAGLPNHVPVGSIRLKLIRDGIDDIELLYMAEELFGREWVDERANKVSKSLISVDVSSDEFAALRLEIGNAIEVELNN